MPIRDANTNKQLELSQINVNDILAFPHNGINSFAELMDVHEGRAPDLFVTLDRRSGRYATTPFNVGIANEDVLVPSSRRWPPPAWQEPFVPPPTSQIFQNLIGGQAPRSNDEREILGLPPISPHYYGTPSSATNLHFDQSLLRNIFGTTNPELFKGQPGLPADAPILDLTGFQDTENLKQTIVNTANNNSGNDGKIKEDLNNSESPNLVTDVADWKLGDSLSAVEFQNAWNMVMETGKIPVNAIRFIEVETEDPNNKEEKLIQRVLRSESQQLLSLQQSFLQERQFALQLYGVPEDQADTEAGTLAYKTFQEQQRSAKAQETLQKRALSEQERGTLIAEEQARAGLTGYLPGYRRRIADAPDGTPQYEFVEAEETLAAKQFDLESLLRQAALTGTVPGVEDAEDLKTVEQQALDLNTWLQQAGITGAYQLEGMETPAQTMAAQQFALERALAGGLLPAVGDAPARRSLEAQRLAGRLQGEPRLLLDAYNRPVLDDQGQPIYQTPLGDQTLEARIAESQMDLGEAASTLATQRLTEEQRQFNQRLQQERDLATGYTDFGQTVASRQQEAQVEMARQALEAQQARAALQAITGMSQAAMQSPYGFGAFRALGGLGGGTQQAQQQIAQQLSPVGFQFPQGDQAVQAGTPTPAQRFFPTGIPTLGSMAQLPSSGQEQLQAVLGMTGTSPGQFGRLAGSITPSVRPQEQKTVKRRQQTTTGGAAI